MGGAAQHSGIVYGHTLMFVGMAECLEASFEPRAGARCPKTLEQQVIETERQIKGRITVPGALGIKKHRAIGTDQNVFRTDVAMHQGKPVGSGNVGKFL